MLYRHRDLNLSKGLAKKRLLYGKCGWVQIAGECHWFRQMAGTQNKRLDADWVARERARHERNKRRSRLHEHGER